VFASAKASFLSIFLKPGEDFKRHTECCPFRWCAVNREAASSTRRNEIVWFCGKVWAELVTGELASLCCSLLFTLDSTGHCKTVLNNGGFCQLFNTRPPSPLCHYVIISSTPSLPCLLPSPNRHITKHTQWHCAFSHHHFWHYETASPSQRAPLGAFLMWGGVGPVLWLSDLWCCQKEAMAQHTQGQQAVALEGAAAVPRLLLAEGPPQCDRDIPEKHKIQDLMAPALLTQRRSKKTRAVKENASSGDVIGLLWMRTVLRHEVDGLLARCVLKHPLRSLWLISIHLYLPCFWPWGKYRSIFLHTFISPFHL